MTSHNTMLIIIGTYFLSTSTVFSTSQPNICTRRNITSICMPTKPMSEKEFTFYEALNCGDRNLSRYEFRMKPGICYDLSDFNNEVALLNGKDDLYLYAGSDCKVRERMVSRDDACDRFSISCEPCGGFNARNSSVKLAEIDLWY